jgi:hypothetical protein
MNGHTVVWYCVLSLCVAAAAVAIVFAIIAWNDSQAKRPHRRLERSDIVARGDLFCDGDIRAQGCLRIDHDCQVRGRARVGRMVLESLAFDDLKRIIDVGPVLLTREHGVYRIDTPGANTIHVQLPAVEDVPLQVFIVMVSRAGAGNTVQIDVASGDSISAGGALATTNPAYVMPSFAGAPDFVLLTNDAASTWFAVAHV